MKICLYISELLQDYDCVIFPGLGAFTASAVEAKFDLNNTILQPPSREIKFNTDIKLSDGILLNYYAHRKEISVSQANSEIENLCNEINYRLDHGETIRLESLGLLMRKEDKIIFEADPDVIKLPDAFGLKPVEVKIYDGISKSILPGARGSEIEISTKKKPKRTYSYWVFIIPGIAVLFIIFWFFRSEMLKEKPGKALIELAPQETLLPVVTDSIPVTDYNEVIQNEENASVQEHPAEGLYYLVGGSFKTRENAEQYFEQISKKGYEPVHLGIMGSFHVVAMAVYPSEREAVNAQYNILERDSTAGVWVYYIPGSK